MYSRYLFGMALTAVCSILTLTTIRKFHSHAQWLKVKISGGPLHNQTWHENLAATKAPKFWFSYSHSYTLAIGLLFYSVCQVWLPRGPPEDFTFSDCACSRNTENKVNKGQWDCDRHYGLVECPTLALAKRTRKSTQVFNLRPTCVWFDHLLA